jgi:hypothetical protein
MPNFLQEEPIKALSARLVAHHLGGVVPQPALERLMRLVVSELRGDERNATPAREDDIADTAPPWAKAALARGVELHLFHPLPQAVQRIKRMLRNLRLAHTDTRAYDPADQALRTYALRMFENLEHMSFADLETKARAQARMRARVEKRRAEAAMQTLGFCEQELIPVGADKRWRRITSVAQLGETGKKMRNCTAFDRPQSANYGKMLMDGDAEFWVLETLDGEAFLEVMVSTAHKTVMEYLGPGNRAVDPNSPELAVLMRAKGFTFKRARHAPTRETLIVDLRAVLRRELNAELDRLS